MTKYAIMLLQTKKMIQQTSHTGENAGQGNRQLAEKVYNQIMQEIDEDLLLENIPTLDNKYANETKTEHAARMKRYEKSYSMFDAEMNNFLTDVHGRSRKSKRAALKKKEKSAQVEENTILESLETQFQ